MSIPSLNKPSDYDKFFSRYLADLKLQVKLNQENYDANVAFFKTGVQATERADTRSLEQRSTDVETLKIQARAMLNKLTNSNSADEVLTFLINNNLLFFFVQNFVDFERTINKRYPSQTASAAILRVLLQKSFDKQNDEIPLLKDELIVATNSVASRESINNLLDKLYYTNYALYEDLKQGLDLFPTMQEKLNIVKFPEKKFREEIEIKAWGNLPNNKQVQELADLYEQLNSGTSPNIESTQNQINNLEESIGNQLIASEQGLHFSMRSHFKNQDIANKAQEQTDKELFKGIDNLHKYNVEPKIKLKHKEGKKAVVEDIKQMVQRHREYMEQMGMEEAEIKQRVQEREQEIRRERARIQVKEQKGMKQAELEQRQIREEREKELRVAKANKGRQQTIDPSSYISASKYKPKGNLKPNVAIQEPIDAELVEQDEFTFITPKKVKSAKAKEEPIYTRVDQDLLQKYLNNMPDMTLEELKTFSKKHYNIKYSKLKEELGDNANKTNLRIFIATQQYLQDNKYEISPTEIEPLNELTRGSYSDKVFIPDPNVNVIEDMEGKGLLTKRQQDSHRFKVLQGQILAGNNSKKIVMELKALILKMNKLGEISNKKASAVLQELNSVLK